MIIGCLDTSGFKISLHTIKLIFVLTKVQGHVYSSSLPPGPGGRGFFQKFWNSFPQTQTSFFLFAIAKFGGGFQKEGEFFKPLEEYQCTPA